jgi:hypothetical protein
MTPLDVVLWIFVFLLAVLALVVALAFGMAVYYAVKPKK